MRSAKEYEHKWKEVEPFESKGACFVDSCEKPRNVSILCEEHDLAWNEWRTENDRTFVGLSQFCHEQDMAVVQAEEDRIARREVMWFPLDPAS
jgi:hypothetical protein